MMPKNRALIKENIRIGRCSQKTRHIKNGSPVCPEKKRSLPVLKKKKLLILYIVWSTPVPNVSIGNWSGNGPICVSVMNNERVTINKATLFKINGTLRGS